MPDPSDPHSSGFAERRGFWAALVFLSLFAIYHANWTVLEEGDPATSAKLPIALLADHSFAFSPDRFPELFKWKGHAPLVEIDDVPIDDWLLIIGDRTAWDWRASGHLEFNEPRYFLVQAPRKRAYVSVFGPVPGLVVLPLIAPFYAFDPLIHTKPILYASIVKLGSAALVAACAALIFLIAARYTTGARALLLAAIYGIGTCAWAVSSQNIWQQTVNQALLTAGAYFLLGNMDRFRVAACAGLFFASATACRQTSGLVLIAAGVYVALKHRRSLLPFGLAALPLLVAIGVYNAHYFGNPLVFGQALAGPTIAREKTGSPELWQTPFYVGALGLLLSPSRGLLIFSPALAPFAWGMLRVFRDSRWRSLRPLVVATLATMALQCMWFDWWGGHAYGYRPWLDVMPYLVVSLLPVIDALVATPVRCALYGVILGWSIFVQALGAWSYDRTWNFRTLHVVRRPDGSAPAILLDQDEAVGFAESSGGSYVGPVACDVDKQSCRYRLWSVSDNMIGYYLTHFREAHRRRWPAFRSEPEAPP